MQVVKYFSERILLNEVVELGYIDEDEPVITVERVK